MSKQGAGLYIVEEAAAWYNKTICVTYDVLYYCMGGEVQKV